MVALASAVQDSLENLATRIVESVQPSSVHIRRSIQNLRTSHPHLADLAIAQRWGRRACLRYAAGGAATALPSVIPGLGTSAQLALDGGTIAADMGYMLRCMGDIVMGTGHIFGHDIEAPFNEEFVRVLGLWCGAVSLGKEAALRIGTRVAMSQVKRLPAEVLKALPQRVGRNLLARVGVGRASVAVGRLIPFGVGAVIGGGFNYATMRGFKNATIEYYASASSPVD